MVKTLALIVLCFCLATSVIIEDAPKLKLKADDHGECCLTYLNAIIGND